MEDEKWTKVEGEDAYMLGDYRVEKGQAYMGGTLWRLSHDGTDVRSFDELMDAMKHAEELRSRIA